MDFPKDLPLPAYVPPPPIPVFFPPTPPVLEAVTKPSVQTSYAHYAAPALLGGYPNELFYPALAARLNLGELSKTRRARVEQYHEEKRALQQELRTELTAILRLDPSARQPRLAGLAANQDARIADLEKREEDLRDDLLKGDYSWNALREWTLSARARANESPLLVAKVMLAAAYFQSGLSVPQREALREVSLGLSTTGNLPADRLTAGSPVFFSPALTRVRFPAELAEPTARKITDYLARRAVLRQQLYEAVYRQDSAWFDVKRTIILKTLAGRQAAEFAALEGLAEEIRRELPGMKAPARYQPPASLPPALMERMSAIFQQNWAEQRRVRQEAAKLQERYPALRVDGYFSQGTFLSKISYSKATSKNMALWKQAAEDFKGLKESYDRKMAELTRARDALRPEIAAAVHSSDLAALNVALAEGYRYAIDQTVGGAIDDYFTAAMEPGLSSGQRRLLFDAAIEQLNLPLPAGELQPVRKPLRVGYDNRG